MLMWPHSKIQAVNDATQPQSAPYMPVNEMFVSGIQSMLEPKSAYLPKLLSGDAWPEWPGTGPGPEICW